MSKSSPLLYGAYKLLGGRVAEVEPIFGAMACMRNVEREEFAMCEILKVAFPDAPEFHAFLTWIERMLQLRGMALWPRTEVTDLSAKAQAHPSRKERDVSDFIPPELIAQIEYEGLQEEPR